MAAAFLQVAIESAIFSAKGRYFMTVNLGHPDSADPINLTPTVHRTSASSGHSASAIFNVHSFNIGDVSQVSPDTYLDFKAYRLVSAAGSSLGQDFIGTF